MRAFVFEVDEDVGVVLDAAEYVSNSLLLVVRDANEVDAPLAHAGDLAQDLPLLFQ